MPEDDDLAIALRYDQAIDPLPYVTAKGRGGIARQIVAIAKERGIPVRRDADLAQILQQIKIDTAIPVAAFAAVAEIMALLYRANLQEAKAKGRT